MATYKVGSDGNAPKNVKTGDVIVTAGGSYEIMDSSAYQGLTPDQLKANNVSYNPTSGLYSRKVGGPTTNDVSLVDSSVLSKWFDDANASALARIDSAYNTNVASAERAYNDSRSGYEQSIEDAKSDYLSAITRNQANAYKDSVMALEGAENRGLVSSGLGQALTNSSLWGASMQDTEITRDRDSVINQLKRDINNLTKNHNITLTELEKNKLNAEIEQLSDIEVNYLLNMLDVEKYNTGALNQYKLMDKDHAHQEKMLQMQLAASRALGGDGDRSGEKDELENMSFPDKLNYLSDLIDATMNLNDANGGGSRLNANYEQLYQDAQLRLIDIDDAISKQKDSLLLLRRFYEGTSKAQARLNSSTAKQPQYIQVMGALGSPPFLREIKPRPVRKDDNKDDNYIKIVEW